MLVNKKPNLNFNESKFYFVNYFNNKVRELFRKLDKLDKPKTNGYVSLESLNTP